MKQKSRTPRPKKSLGQNFLVDGNLQRKIVEAVDPQPEDSILEIGPGRGALTRHLAGKCRELFLVELDDELAEGLSRELRRLPGTRILNMDVLDLDLSRLTPEVERLKVVGNIPYNITTPILFHFLQRPRPREMVIMVQKEVADRIVAEPGTGEYGALSVGVQSVASVEKLFKVPATAFRPQPKVDSMVLRLVPLRPEPMSGEEEAALRELTRIVFQQRRKQIQTILRNHPRWALSHEEVEVVQDRTGLDLDKRPEELSPQELFRLSGALQTLRPAGSGA